MKKNICQLLAGIIVCASSFGQSLSVSPGTDLADFVNRKTRYSEFLLQNGTYSTGNGHCITRNNIVIRKENPADEIRIAGTLQVCGDNNVIDGLTWDADMDNEIRSSNPGTLAISGSGNTIRHCIFKNMRATVNGNKIIIIGRQLTNDGRFLDTEANNNTIEFCTFDNWGLRDEPKGSTKSSACIAVGLEDDKGKFTGTRIQNNLFINGPYKQYGYNAACKIFNATILQNNVFAGGQECMEVKYGNCCIKGNIIHHFSGFNILANRYGRNNLYENNTVYDVEPIDETSSAPGFMIWEAGNTVYRNNVIYNCSKAGQILGKETDHNSLMKYVLIENNTFVDNKKGINFDNKKGIPKNIAVTRNIFYGYDSSKKMYSLANYDTASIQYFNNNLFYNNMLSAGERPLTVDPLFKDKDNNDFRLKDQSPACGYGAFPCPGKDRLNADSSDPAHYIVLYPTSNKYIFHVGLVGLDINPISLEIDDQQGHPLIKRDFTDPVFKVVDNIDLSANQKDAYLLKINTDKGNAITKYITPDN